MIDEKKLIEEFQNCVAIRATICGEEKGEIFFPPEDIENVINSQPKIGEWIPCSERLPEETMYVLVCYKGGAVAVGKYGYNTTHEYKCFWVGFVREENIIAWQPLPEAYKERQENEQ